ncbi:hypothetical protein MES4922_550014 [Mesorhizobium ventifaucium]|uniref:Uncharacterized protein n=1 Tax=Mesorhizobium ventifaucium TaxID=666020 RepID=A0ABM9EBY3_9HYPH|nr:hypothetical protein MES4922_550014 [Mesorhizobium ventifaucium]
MKTSLFIISGTVLSAGCAYLTLQSFSRAKPWWDSPLSQYSVAIVWPSMAIDWPEIIRP